MAKKKPPALIETRHLVHIWSCRGRLAFLSDAPQCGSGYVLHATVDVNRPFRHHVPSVVGSGPSGLVFEGMTGENARPWSPSQVLSAARFGLFGFRLEDTP